MPTFRKLHTKIIDSFDFAEMPDDFTRVFWLLLIVAADSEGRMIDNYAWLRSRMYPLRSDVTDGQIEATLTWLVDRGMIIRYTVEGRGYFYIVKFKNYQTGTEREAKSVLPSPQELVASNSRVTQEAVRPAVSASVYESVNESVYAVYEKEIGILTAGISDELKVAEQDYPAGWVADALREASRNNKRSWKYALGILRRWEAEGRNDFKKLERKQPAKNYTGQIILPDGTIQEATA